MNTVAPPGDSKPPRRHFVRCLLGLVLLVLVVPGWAVEFETPKVVLQGIGFEVGVQDPMRELAEHSVLTLQVNAETYQTTMTGGAAVFEELRSSDDAIIFQLRQDGRLLAERDVPTIASWVSLLPSLFAVTVALLTRQVLLAIFAAIWVGAWMSYGFTGMGIFYGLLDSANVYVVDAISDKDNTRIILFSLLVGGTVGLISRAGGTMGIVNALTRVIRGRRDTQTTTAFLGLAVFFDDYANAIIVGNTMRSVVDRMRISRAKLAYLVDSTAAPVATFMMISTWIGFQLGLIAEGTRAIDGFTESAYSVFVNAIPYNFYPILCIGFLLMVATSGRDFGPMLRAEVDCLRTGAHAAPHGESDEEMKATEHTMAAKQGIPHLARNALVPLLVLIGGTLLGIVLTGLNNPARADDSLREIIGNADSYSALVWASLGSSLTAGVMAMAQRLLTLEEAIDAFFAGMMSMMFAIIILLLVWALTGVNETLQTSQFLVETLGDSLPPAILPTVIFMLAAVMAFATGASWGVMGIMMPLVVPLSWAVLEHHGFAGDPAYMHIFYSSVACVLAGAVWGDHCSPLSDTTVLSAMSSGCDLIEHVRTQLPYALLVGTFAIAMGTLPAGMGMPWWLSYLVVPPILFLLLRLIGKRAEDLV
jgi:Na+/H+ antiporter NhaC